MKTYFAPAERLKKSEVLLQNKELISVSFLNEILSASNTIFLILNEERQVVLANNAFLKVLNMPTESELYGDRLGEILNCKYSSLTDGGCGTSEHCIKCGAVNAIIYAIEGEENEQVFRLLTAENNAVDFQIKAKLLTFQNTKYIFISAIDISDSKRKEVLERTFFHDILNTAGGLYGLAEILKTDKDEEPHTEFYDTIYNLTDKLVKEIEHHRILISAENGSLKLNIGEINLNLFLEMIKNMVENNQAIQHVKLEIKADNEYVYFSTDPILLQRVLINMVKNAAEASDPGDVVTLAGEADDEHITISVHNPKYITEEIRTQIFQRSFSTKGTGRGIGTYSMKLFGEKYLGGEVNFITDKKDGTTFYIKIRQRETLK